MDTNTQSNPADLQWQAPRIPNHERGKTWYMIGGGAIIAMAAYGLISGAWSFAIVILLCGAMYFLVRDHSFGNSTCTINDLGVQIDEIFTPWSDIAGYWFLQLPTYTEIHFSMKRPHSSDLRIQIGSLSPNDMRTFIRDKSVELTDKGEGFLDMLLRLTKL
jgi:hypothetical protein